MPKKRSKSGEEFWRGQVRELQKENRALKKQLRQYEKFELSQDEEIITDTEDTYVELKKLTKCLSDSCGKGIYVEMELMNKVFGTCNVCGDRRRLK